MLYIHIGGNTVKVMCLKKSLLGQYEASFAKKTFPEDILANGKPKTESSLSTSVKEVVGMVDATSEKDVTLILPQDSFIFMKVDKPSDLSENVLGTHLKDQARAETNFNPETDYYDFTIRENENDKKIVFYGASKSTVEAFESTIKSINLNLKAIVPESLAYFKLFEKTLRKNKKENIWFVNYEENKLVGYVYDSFGLAEETKWSKKIDKDTNIEPLFQEKANELAAKGIKLNRLILSGKQSESVRQDTFTKNVGVWTNPLKRILPHFYSDYMKALAGQENKEVPVLEYAACFGAYVLGQEDNSFTLFKGSHKAKSKRSFSKPSISLPNFGANKKGIIFFLASFVVTFGLLFAYSKFGTGFMTNAFDVSKITKNIPFVSEPTATPIPPTPTTAPPTPTPTPEIAREEVRVQILNGSGIAGKASDVKTFLRDKGYADILTANADNFDYEQTVIQTKDDSIKNIFYEDVVSEIEDKPKYEDLDEDDAADVVIIVGTDFR